MSNELGPLYERLGELGGLLKGVDISLNEMKQEHSVIREKITEVETHVASLNSVEKKLGHIGINYQDPNEFRDLISWVKKEKASSESNKQNLNKILITVATTVSIGLLVLLGNYVWSGIKKDIHANTTTIQQSPANGLPRGNFPRQRSHLQDGGTTGQP